MASFEREVFELAAVPLWVVELGGEARVVEANGRARALFSPEVMRGLRTLEGEREIELPTIDGQRARGRLSIARLQAEPNHALVTFERSPPEESELRFRTMADAAPVLLWMAGKDGECNFFNKTWLDFSGRSMETELGVGWAEGVYFEDFQRCMHTYLQAFVDREPFRMEYRLRRHDGVYRWILDHGVPCFGPGGGFTGFIGSCIDITQLKELQLELDARVRDRTERLAAALAERETLVKEVHHRVKNNLQVISSLINMQARHLEGRDPATVLEESQGRIFSIALVHERLYRAKDLAHVDFAEYVRSLTENIMHTFGSEARVRAEIEISYTELGVDLAIPCGLIIHELLTNALKYAFPEGRAGVVRISMHREGDTAALEVADDGVGLPAEVDPGHGASLGLFLVTTLAEQLEASLEVRREGGAAFRIQFPV